MGAVRGAHPPLRTPAGEEADGPSDEGRREQGAT